MIDECYESAKEVIRKNIFSNGIFASPGYNALWSRDSMISFLGASLVKDPLFEKAFRNSLITLAGNQSALGQIPNAVDKYSKRKPHVDYGSIDSTLWFVIGEYVYQKRYGSTLFNMHSKNIKSAITWLRYRGFGEDGMLEQMPTTDWQDAFPHKYGHVINTQALYYKVLSLSKQKKAMEKLKRVVNTGEKRLWNTNYYLPWRWKSHNKYHEYETWFDSLGNLLAIVFGLADQSKSEKILSHIRQNKINQPYPVKAIFPPIKPGDKGWQDYFNDCDARKPYHYLNGGIWTYIGGFYVLALIRCKKYKEAEHELQKLAEANLNNRFPEWIDPITKEPYGYFQTWNAGMYILAYLSFKEKKVLL